MDKAEKLKLCRGCRDNFYNGFPDGCWSLESAKPVQRIQVGIWQPPPYAYLPQTTLNCHRQDGYAWIAVDDVRVVKDKQDSIPVNEDPEVEMTETTELTEHETQRQEFIAGLRKMADFYEQRPGLAAPGAGATAYYFSYTKEDAAQRVKAIGASRTEDSKLEVTRIREFGGGVEIQHNISKSGTCEQVKVGERVIPAQPARPAQPETVEDVYEWRCPEGLLKDLHRTPQEQEA